jgi:glycosyltransferase involved in cell wall biosynthesis
MVRRKVLLITYDVNGEDISEPRAAFNFVERMHRVHDVTLICCNKPENAGAARRQIPGLRIFEWVRPAILGKWSRFDAIVAPYYPVYYQLARRHIRSLLASEKFDLIHQLSPFSARYPSLGYGMRKPLLIGPVGGSVETPSGFRKEVGESSPLFDRLRQIDRLRLRRDPLLRKSFASACLVLGVAPYVKELFRDVPIRDFDVMNEHGVDVERSSPSAGQLGLPGHLKLLYVGRIIRTKGLRDAIRALGYLKQLPGVTLDVIGDGEDLSRCKQETIDLGLGGRIRFHGRVPRPQIDRFYAAADFLVFPSFRESSGGVVLEAMCQGTPVVVASNCGPAFIAGNHASIQIAPVTPGQFAHDLAAALRSLAMDPQKRLEMRSDAWRRVLEAFDWNRKVEQLSGLYERAIRNAAEWSPHGGKGSTSQWATPPVPSDRAEQ